MTKKYTLPAPALAIALLLTCESQASTGWESEFRGNRLMVSLDRVLEESSSTENSAEASLPEDPMDSINLENDIMGLRLWGPATQPTLSFGRSDVWDRRSFHKKDRVFTLDEIRQLADIGQIDRVRFNDGKGYGTTSHNMYDFPVSKPVGQLIFGTPFGTEAKVHRHNFGHATLVVHGEEKKFVANIRVFPNASTVAIDIEQEGLSPGDFWFRIYRHRDTITPGTRVCPTLGGRASGDDFEQLPAPTAFFSEGIIGGIEQRFFPDRTFPQGFFSILAATVDVATTPAIASIDVDENLTKLGTPLSAKGGKEGRIDHMTVKRYTPINTSPGAAATFKFHNLPPKLSIYAIITTSQSPPQIDQSARALALESLLQIRNREPVAVQEDLDRDYAGSVRPHRAQAFINNKIVFEAPAFFLQQIRKPGQYFLDLPLASVGSTKFQFQDQGIWKHGITFNEIMAEPMLTMGLFPELKTYVEYVATMLPAAREHARNIYGLPGAKFPLNDYPLLAEGGFVNTNQVWDKDMGLNGLVTKPLWLYYKFTGDKESLRSTIYPVLKDASLFMEAFLTKEADGKYHIIPTVSPEDWGLTNNFERNKNATSALTLTRYLFHATADAADTLDMDSAWAVGLRKKASLLAPFPTTKLATGERIWTDVEGAPNSGVDGRGEFNIPTPLSPVFWGDEVGPDSENRIKDMALRTLQNINVWPPHQFYLHYVRSRLGIPQNNDLLTPESFLSSFQSIQLFPGIPKGYDAEIKNLRAQGGYLISAKRDKHGHVSDLRITSTLGGNVQMRNPWPRQTIIISQDAGPDHTITQSPTLLTFPTFPNTSYTIVPKPQQP